MFIVAQLRSDRNLSHYHGQKQIGCIKKRKSLFNRSEADLPIISYPHFLYPENFISCGLDAN